MDSSTTSRPGPRRPLGNWLPVEAVLAAVDGGLEVEADHLGALIPTPLANVPLAVTGLVRPRSVQLTVDLAVPSSSIRMSVDRKVTVGLSARVEEVGREQVALRSAIGTVDRLDLRGATRTRRRAWPRPRRSGRERGDAVCLTATPKLLWTGSRL